MKKVKKIIPIFIMILLIISMITNFTYADVNPKDYESDVGGGEKVADIGNKIVGVIQLLGNFLSIAVVIVIGIKYMLGSAEEKAQYKETMKPYIIGAVLVFAVTNILGIVENLMS